LKLANIKITPDGVVKVLDFGLAKLAARDTADPSPDVTQSPTMIGGTREGVILGTAGYMSPDQARGNASVDKRADVWAFGCVLFETLAGRKAFAGETATDTLAAMAGPGAATARSCSAWPRAIRSSASPGRVANLRRSRRRSNLAKPASRNSFRTVVISCTTSDKPPKAVSTSGRAKVGRRGACWRQTPPAAHAPSGQLLFIRQDTLFAQKFDPVRLALIGEPYNARCIRPSSPMPAHLRSDTPARCTQSELARAGNTYLRPP
jgi:serine/threonine protein kinase